MEHVENVLIFDKNQLMSTRWQNTFVEFFVHSKAKWHKSKKKNVSKCRQTVAFQNPKRS